MRLFPVLLVLASTAAAAAPAMSQLRGEHQSFGNDRQTSQRYGEIPRSDWARDEATMVVNFMRDFDGVKGRIRKLARRGIVSPGEAADLRREAREIGIRLRRDRRDGLTENEFYALLARADRLDRRVRASAERPGTASQVKG